MKITPPLYPVKYKVYTLEQIIQDLTLGDSPCLQFQYQGMVTGIQDSHLTDEELLSVPGAKESKWKYIFTSSEWIPVFRAVDDEAVLAFVDIEKEIDPYRKEHELSWWTTPKGFPRKQYYDKSDE